VNSIAKPVIGAEQQGPAVGTVVWQIVTKPYDTFIRNWNWKAATLSSGLRAPIFLLTSLSHGLHRAIIAMLVEAVFRASTTGFFAAVTQALRKAQPTWKALLVMLTIFPAITLALDLPLHMAMHTRGLARGMFVAILLSSFASVFDLYVMKRGTLIVGGEGKSFLSDLKSLPLLAFRFVLEPPIWAWRLTRQLLVGTEAESANGD
jgi:hypothetical protein